MRMFGDGSEKYVRFVNKFGRMCMEFGIVLRYNI